MKIFNYILATSLGIVLFAGCLKETYPTSIITEKQLGQSSSAIAAMSRSSAAVFNLYGSTYDAFGYPGIMMWRDVMSGDIPPYATSYDYHTYYAQCQYLGNYVIQQFWWSLFYKIILNADLLLSAAEGNDDPEINEYVGNAYCYRAYAYLDLARMYEYHETGFPELDAEAESRGIYGLTVPIYTEKTTEEEAKNNPRAPFYQMYRFILTDLSKAEELLDGHVSSACNKAGISMVYALKARTWLELASRFDATICNTGDSDLQTMLAHESDYPELEKMDVKSAKECYENAKHYAKLAMAYHQPLTKEQWYNAQTGFNTEQNAWIFGMKIGTEDVGGSWQTFTGNMSPETTYGTANTLYQCFRMIDAALYTRIGDGDWRKRTWIDPADAGKKSAYSKYTTLLSEEEFVKCPAYANFKFHPGSGEMDNYLVGNVVDIPLIRIEEMYLIEAEAEANINGLAAGCNALKSYLNTYRYDDGSYATTYLEDMGKFRTEILNQRRIEFWGEGHVIFDYRRLRKAVMKGYYGSNFPESYQYNSIEGYVPAWSTVYITSSEYQYNLAIEDKNNPDPSGCGIKWSN
ncbi:MAG: RagB/SusD family nutrient uptake outer membrane protein [Candidatus Cryptobacteroides sp.]